MAKRILLLVLVLSLVLGGTISALAEMDKGSLFFPELPNNTLSITVNTANFGNDTLNTRMQQLWQEKMEDYLGVKLDIKWNIKPWADFRANESVLLAADDLADINTYSQGSLVNEYGEYGQLLDINKYKDYFVYYPDFLQGAVGGPEAVNNEDGSSYVFWDGYDNDLDLAGAQSFTGFAYRFDVLKAHDLTPATTWQEFVDLSAKLKALIDEGKVDAQYVMANTGKNYSFYRGFVGIFHTWDTTYWNGEKWSFGPIEDNFRTMLGEINKLYEAGYIDPEFATLESIDQKASTGQILMIPTLWAGSPFYWNTASEGDIEWGLAYLPEHPDYGTPWKWGSKLNGKNLGTNLNFGIMIDADTKYPEYVVRLVDYQYSEDIYELLNWGVEGETYMVQEDGTRTYTDNILNAENPGIELANFGIMSSSSARSGIPFVPQIFSTITKYSKTEPWWNPEEGYYDGRYWIESARLGGPESVSPFDRAPLVKLTKEEQTFRATLTSAAGTYASAESLKFITGELDVHDDAVWQRYVEGVKSQISGFDDFFNLLNEKTDLESLKFYQ